MGLSQYIFYNTEFQFVSGLNITGIEDRNFDIKIFKSETKATDNWQDVPFEISYIYNNATVLFDRPVNNYQFRIDLVSANSSSFQFNFKFQQPLSKADIIDYVSTKHIVFGGCARDCQENILSSLENLSKLGKIFKKYEIVIFENDSNDKTLEILNKHTDELPLTIISEKDLDKVFVTRTQRLSYARNQIFDQIKLRDPDYHCIADMDGVLGADLSLDTFLTNFSMPDVWDAVFPVNEKLYYDVWAFRHKNIYSNDYMREVENFHPQFSYQDALNINLRSIAALDYQNLRGWLRVESAFGGMGIYNTKFFRNCRYFGISGPHEICEHVAFHTMANKAGGALYINPAFKLNSLLI